jgi:hypothetical protein
MATTRSIHGNNAHGEQVPLTDEQVLTAAAVA